MYIARRPSCGGPSAKDSFLVQSFLIHDANSLNSAISASSFRIYSFLIHSKIPKLQLARLGGCKALSALGLLFQFLEAQQALQMHFFVHAGLEQVTRIATRLDPGCRNWWFFEHFRCVPACAAPYLRSPQNARRSGSFYTSKLF